MKNNHLKRNIKLFGWFNFFECFRLYSPILIIYFDNILNSLAFAMSIFSISMISAAIFEVPSGILSDMLSRKKVMVIGAIIGIISAILYAIGINYWFLFIGAILQGITKSLYSGNNEALLYDSLKELKKEEKFQDILGKTTSMFQLSLAIATLFGAFIANWSFSWVMWLTVLSQIICLIISLFFIEPVKKEQIDGNIYKHLKGAFKVFFINKKLRLLSLSHIIIFGTGEALYNFQSIFYQSILPVWALGIPKVIDNVLGFISLRLGAKINKKLGIIKMFIFANIYSRTMQILAASINNLISPFLMAISQAFYGAGIVGFSDLMHKEFNQKQRATMTSLNSLVGSLLFAIVSILIGIIADKSSPNWAIISGNIIIFVTIIFQIKLLKIYKK